MRAAAASHLEDLIRLCRSLGLVPRRPSQARQAARELLGIETASVDDGNDTDTPVIMIIALLTMYIVYMNAASVAGHAGLSLWLFCPRPP